MADEENNAGTPEEFATPEPEETTPTNEAPETPEAADEPANLEINQDELNAMLEQAGAETAEPAAEPTAEAETTVNQDELNAMLEQAGAEAAEPTADASEPVADAGDAGAGINRDELDAMLNQAAADGGADSAEADALEPTSLEISQDELDAMIAAANGQPPPPRKPAPAATPTAAAAPPSSMGQSAVDSLLAQAATEVALSGVGAAADGPAIVGGGLNHANPDELVSEYGIPDLDALAEAAPFSAIDLLDDVELNVKIELGRTEMYIEDVLQLGAGSVVELNKLAGDPVDIYVNEQLIARGEVLVLNDNFCVRINAILSPIPELSSTA